MARTGARGRGAGGGGGRRGTSRRIRHGNAMQMVRIDVARRRLPVRPDGQARAPGNRAGMRVVRLDVLRWRLPVQPDREAPPRRRPGVPLVRVRLLRGRMPLRPGGQARALKGKGGAGRAGRFGSKSPHATFSLRPRPGGCPLRQAWRVGQAVTRACPRRRRERRGGRTDTSRDAPRPARYFWTSPRRRP